MESDTRYEYKGGSSDCNYWMSCFGCWIGQSWLRFHLCLWSICYWKTRTSSESHPIKIFSIKSLNSSEIHALSSWKASHRYFIHWKCHLVSFRSLFWDYLVTARPTAVNMNEAAVRFKKVLKNLPADLVERKEKLITLLEDMLRSVFKMII